MAMLAAVLGPLQLQNGLTGIKRVQSRHLAHQLRGVFTVRDPLQHMQVQTVRFVFRFHVLLDLGQGWPQSAVKLAVESIRSAFTNHLASSAPLTAASTQPLRHWLPSGPQLCSFPPAVHQAQVTAQ